MQPQRADGEQGSTVQCAISDISLLSLIIEQNKPHNHCTIKSIELVRQGCNGKIEFSCIGLVSVIVRKRKCCPTRDLCLL